MVDLQRVSKNNTIKNWIILGLVIVIVVLWFSNTLSDDTKSKFMWLIGIALVIIFIFYLLKRDSKIDIYKLAKETKLREARFTGDRENNFDESTLDCRPLDSRTLVFGFPGNGKDMSYYYDIKNQQLTGRVPNKGVGDIIFEANNREISKAAALHNIKNNSDIVRVTGAPNADEDEEELK